MQIFYTVLLLFISNCFMTLAWYGHLKYTYLPLWIAIFASWGIALAEYVFQVPANRIGYTVLSAYQLKIIQECLSLIVFVGFAGVYLGEGFSWRYAIAFLLILAAVVIAFYE